MKTQKAIIAILGITLITFPVLNGQKIMKLSNELKSSSQPAEVKRKGMSTVGKYEFGPYRIVSGKGGWGIGTSKKKMFSF